MDLTWTAATDNSGVIDKYDIYRNGSPSPIATVNGNLTSYADLTVSASTAYSYTVRARDASGNASVDSNVAQVTTPSIGVLFADDFESGSLSTWTNVTGLTVTQGVPSPSGGLWVARETSASAGGTYAYKSISPTQTELYAKFRFQVVSRTGSVDLMRFRNATGGSKLSLYVSGTSGTLSTRNAAGTSTRAAGPTIVNGQWYTVEIHAKIASPTVTEVWLDGVHLTALDATGDIGATAIGQFLVGTTAAGTYDVVIDDVAVGKELHLTWLTSTDTGCLGWPSLNGLHARAVFRAHHGHRMFISRSRSGRTRLPSSYRDERPGHGGEMASISKEFEQGVTGSRPFRDRDAPRRACVADAVRSLRRPRRAHRSDGSEVVQPLRPVGRVGISARGLRSP